VRTAEDFVVSLDRFEGPLDLLLYLIRKHEVDIEDIPLAPLTDQYIAHLHGLDRIDVDTAAEFLVMAATLMEIKSRLLAPLDLQQQAAREDAAAARSRSRDEAADPRAELIEQLLAYKRYRDAADALDARRDEWNRRFPSARAAIDKDALRAAQGAEEIELDAEDLDLMDLVRAFARIAESVNFEAVARGAHEIGGDETPIELHAEDLLEHLRGPRENPRAPRSVSLREAAQGKTRPEIIGIFLALLELMKCGVVTVRTTLGDATTPSDVRIELKPEVANDAESLSAPAGDLLTRAVNSAIAGDTPVPQAWDEDDEFAGDDDDDDDDVV
jgi:segregation and condensation protein A